MVRVARVRPAGTAGMAGEGGSAGEPGSTVERGIGAGLGRRRGQCTSETKGVADSARRTMRRAVHGECDVVEEAGDRMVNHVLMDAANLSPSSAMTEIVRSSTGRRSQLRRADHGVPPHGRDVGGVADQGLGP